MTDTTREFMGLLRAEVASFADAVRTPDGQWVVKGFIDVFRNVYAVPGDTKVISKLLELMLFPQFARFAGRHALKLVLSREQNHYPDLSFIDSDGTKYAVDLKTTYRRNEDTANTMTLGAFTGYFRDRLSAKNVTFPYDEYQGHFVVGAVYTRADDATEGQVAQGLERLEHVQSAIRDIVFFVQPKFAIASDTPGSGNTKNIGAVRSLSALLSGAGPFSALGQDVFDDYWMHYLTADMARAAELAAPPYSNLQSYWAFKRRLLDKEGA
jgi:hypothetical protein